MPDNNSNPIDLNAIEIKLTKARTQLILDKPFLGNLVLRLPLKPAQSWCKTSATDAKNFYYNPEFIAQLSSEQTKFVLIHEALHCALTHFARRGHRQKHRWDLACDFAINPLLVKEGFHPPLDVPIFRQYNGMIAEEIYPMIDDQLDNEPMDQHLYDDQTNNSSQDSNRTMREDNLDLAHDEQNSQANSENNPKQNSNQSEANLSAEDKQNDDQPGANNQILAPQPSALSPDEIQSLSSQWQRYLASSAQLAKQAGKLTGQWLELMDFFLQPQVSWRVLLAQYMSAKARDDFSYYRPSNRSGDAILPSLRSKHINIAVAIDTSGSINQDEINEFISEIDHLKAALSANITLFACDNELLPDCPWQYEPWQALDFPKQLGGGKGTDFDPVFNALAKQDVATDLLIYFTDAQGIFPQIEPNYPVMWLVKGKTPVPWGGRIQLND